MSLLSGRLHRLVLRLGLRLGTDHRVSAGAAGITLNFTGSTLQWTGGSLIGPRDKPGHADSNDFGRGAGRHADQRRLDRRRHRGDDLPGQLVLGRSIINQAGATFDLQGTANLSNAYINGNVYDGGTFTNAGTLEKSTGTGTATIAYTLADTGAIVVDSATLDPTGTVTGTNATITVASGADFLMSGTYAGSFSGSGAGVVQLGSLNASGLTLDIDGRRGTVDVRRLADRNADQRRVDRRG